MTEPIHRITIELIGGPFDGKLDRIMSNHEIYLMPIPYNFKDSVFENDLPEKPKFKTAEYRKLGPRKNGNIAFIYQGIK